MSLRESTPTAVAQRFYDAIARSDTGPQDMIAGVWGHIDALYDVNVDPVEYLVVDDEKVVVIGRYRGSARDGGTAVDAAFAHVITTRDTRMAALHQITDTARWRIPCR